MDDDLNTPRVLAECQHLRAEVNQGQQGLSREERRDVREIFRRCGAPLGLFQLDEHTWSFRELNFGAAPCWTAADQDCTDEWIQEQIQQRAQARSRQAFAIADGIRETLASRGIILEDRPDGSTRWKR